MSRSSPASGSPHAASASIGPLASCSTFGCFGSAEPGGERGLVGRVELVGGDPGGGAVGRREREAGDVAGAGAPAAGHVHADALAGGGVLGEPAGELRRAQHGHRDVEAGVVDLLLGGQRLEQPVAQHPELQAVEERVHLLAVPRPQRQVGGRELERRGRGPAR